MSVPVKPLPAEDLAHVLAHTRKLWSEARGATFFITGGTGFIGRWLLESFTHANDTLALSMRATVLTRDPAAFALKAPHLAARADLQFLQGDMRTFAFPAGRFTHVIHAAADTGVWTKNLPADGLLKNISSDLGRVLDFAAGAGIRCFLLISSGAVYGPQPSGLTQVAEDYQGMAEPLPAGSAWAEGKRLAEQLCTFHAKRHGYAIKIARCFAFVGPLLPLDASYAMGNFIRDALRGGPIQVSGDGTPRRSYLYAADLAVWLWTMLFSAPAGRVYNVGSDDDRSIADHAQCVSEVCGGKIPVRVAQAPKPAQPVLRYVPAINRARDELGLAVWIPEEEGIRRTLAWHGGAGDFSSQKRRAEAPN